MPELDVADFRRQLEAEQLPHDVHSTEAPQRPAALTQPASEEPPHEQHTSDAEAIDGEILPLAPRQAFGRTVDVSKLHSQTDLFVQLNEMAPKNDFGLPKYIHRPDLVHYTLLTTTPAEEGGAGTQALLANAVVHLDYVQGYPTLPNGMPFWLRFDWESSDAYQAFANYLGQQGARSLHLVLGLPPESVLEYYHLNCWAARALAFDMYQSAHHERMRVQRIMSTENKHYLEAEYLFNQVSTALRRISTEKLEDVEPDKLVHMLERISKIQRVAAGLPVGGGPKEAANAPVSVEFTLRQIAKQQSEGQIVDDTVGMHELLQNPDALALAQELSLKVSSGK